MKVFAYCQDCGKTVEMADVQTIKLPNLSFVHRGRCTGERSVGRGPKVACAALLIKKVLDSELIMSPDGHKTPVIVFMSRETPKRLWQDRNGQTVIDGDTVIEKKAAAGEVRTVEDIKIELKRKGV